MRQPCSLYIIVIYQKEVFQPAPSIRDRPALTIRLTEQIISGIIKLYLDGVDF